MTINQAPLVSVIIPVGDRRSPVAELFCEYKSSLQGLNSPFEMIFVLDGPQPSYEAALIQLAAAGEPITVVSLSRRFGEATALMVGFEHAAGGVIVSLPAYRQIEGAEIGKLISALSAVDIAVGCREPRSSGWFETMRRKAFHRLLQSVTRLKFRDLGCNARAFKRKVLDEVNLYGDQDRFLPILAERQGFKVAEIAVRQAMDNSRPDAYKARSYMRGFLDIFTVFFLVRFTKRPLRFFGMVGVATLSLGLLELVYLVFDRVVFHTPLADRPALLLASLFIVLGVQIFALGLLGELIIFTHAGGSKDYQVDRVIHYPGATPNAVLEDPSNPSGSAATRVLAL
ncbi:MAG: glycosyltransferase [Pseudomonadota bacterium]|nr:glycosyltransferase [Pseudomonadota bacterium]